MSMAVVAAACTLFEGSRVCYSNIGILGRYRSNLRLQWAVMQQQ